LMAYLVLTDHGDYVAAPVDSEACISSDDFTTAAARAALLNSETLLRRSTLRQMH
jgi:hypothetical protein